MPIYEYACCQCGKIEEAIQKFSDAPLTTCKHCSGTLTKLISQSSFHLKGGGWYADGYGKKSKGDDSAAAKTTTGSGPSGSNTGSTTESKTPAESGAKEKA